MSDFRDLKCQCCRCHDDFDGCVAFDCRYDFEISLEKAKAISRESGMSVDTIIGLIKFEESKNYSHDDSETLTDFDPYKDSKFLISMPESGDNYKMLIEMDADDLKRLRLEIDAILKDQGDVE